MKRAKQMWNGGRATAVGATLAIVTMICVAQSSSLNPGQVGMPTGIQTGTGAHQAGGSVPASSGGPGSANPAGALDGMASPFPDSSKQKRNDERQRRLVSDTQKLLALTTQLKTEVASTGAEAMSPEMLKQMEEIEKLAKSVKDKMRD